MPNHAAQRLYCNLDAQHDTALCSQTIVQRRSSKVHLRSQETMYSRRLNYKAVETCLDSRPKETVPFQAIKGSHVAFPYGVCPSGQAF